MDERCPRFTRPMLANLFSQIRRSVETRRERGFVIRGDAEKPRFGGLCIGDECSVQTGENWGEYGDFHTHPKTGMPYPNSIDLIGTLLRSHKTICVGAVDDKGPVVNCFATDQFGGARWYRTYKETVDFWRKFQDKVKKEKGREKHRKALEIFAITKLMPLYDIGCTYRPERKEYRQRRLT